MSGELLPILLLYKQNIWCIPPPAAAAAAAATVLSVGTKRSYRASPGHWWRLVAAGRGIGMEMGSEECELL